jgi:hypothetical protein
MRGEGYGFEAGAADHVDGEGGDGVGEAAAESGLARGILAEACGKNATHDALGDVGWIDARAFDDGAHGDGAELDGGEMRERAEELSYGGSRCTDDDDFSHGGSCVCGDGCVLRYEKAVPRQQRSIRRTDYVKQCVTESVGEDEAAM